MREYHIYDHNQLPGALLFFTDKKDITDDDPTRYGKYTPPHSFFDLCFILLILCLILYILF